MNTHLPILISVLMLSSVYSECIQIIGSTACPAFAGSYISTSKDFSDEQSFDDFVLKRVGNANSNNLYIKSFRSSYGCPNYNGNGQEHAQTMLCAQIVAESLSICQKPMATPLCQSTCQAAIKNIVSIFKSDDCRSSDIANRGKVKQNKDMTVAAYHKLCYNKGITSKQEGCIIDAITPIAANDNTNRESEKDPVDKNPKSKLSPKEPVNHNSDSAAKRTSRARGAKRKSNADLAPTSAATITDAESEAPEPIVAKSPSIADSVSVAESTTIADAGSEAPEPTVAKSPSISDAVSVAKSTPIAHAGSTVAKSTTNADAGASVSVAESRPVAETGTLPSAAPEGSPIAETGTLPSAAPEGSPIAETGTLPSAAPEGSSIAETGTLPPIADNGSEVSINADKLAAGAPNAEIASTDQAAAAIIDPAAPQLAEVASNDQAVGEILEPLAQPPKDNPVDPQEKVASDSSSEGKASNNQPMLWSIIGTTIGLILASVIGYVVYQRRKSQDGENLFKSNTESVISYNSSSLNNFVTGNNGVVAREYYPEMPDEVVLNVGDRIEVLESYDDGWAMGENLTTGCRGVFPLQCIQPSTNDGSNPGPSTRMSSLYSIGKFYQ
jgi:hypothetical protein